MYGARGGCHCLFEIDACADAFTKCRTFFPEPLFRQLQVQEGGPLRHHDEGEEELSEMPLRKMSGGE